MMKKVVKGKCPLSSDEGQESFPLDPFIPHYPFILASHH